MNRRVGTIIIISVLADCSTYVEYIRYGQVNFTDANTTVGNVLPIICDSGYEVHGGYGIECTPHGYWEIHATCERAGKKLNSGIN